MRPSERYLTQETYARAWRHIETLREATSLRSWLLTIARNQFLQWVRVRRVETVSLDDASVTDAMTADESAEIDRDLTLKRAVADLDPTLGEMVALHYFTGLTLNEVGIVLDLPVGTVKSRIHRALSALRAVLEGRETDHENKRAGKALADPS